MPTVPAPSLTPLISTAIRLSAITIGWNLVVGGLAVGAWLIAGSLALAGFGLNALIDMSASTVLLWRFWREADHPRAAARLERRAEVAIGVAMVVVAIFLGAEAVHAITARAHPEPSPVGLAITIGSLFVLPWLSHAKRTVAARIRSRALRADAILTGASAALAALALAALVADKALGLWWADAAAASMIAALLVAEVIRAGRTIVRSRAPRGVL